jgi:hypothetical protein
VFRIWVKRSYCKLCRSSDALLPSFCLLRRLDAVEVIGPAVKSVAAGLGTRSVAKRIGELFAYTTVRGWWRRHRERAASLLGLVAGAAWWRRPLPSGATESDSLLTLENIGAAVSTAVGVPVWPAVSVVLCGAWLTTSTTPVTAGSWCRLITVMAADDSRIPP